MTITNCTRVAALALGIAAIAGCKSQNQAYKDSAAGSVAMRDTTNNSMNADTIKHDTTATPIQIADVKIGKAIDTEKKISNETDDFMPRDSVYVVVHTTGNASNAKLNVRVNAEDGKVVSDHSETISPTGDTYTAFHVSKAGGMKVGKYTAHVSLNGSDLQTKDFSVKKSK